MITIQDIKGWAKPHSGALGGLRTHLVGEQLEISIVGGRQGLYGDFVEDFELAIIDRKTRDFVTRFFVEGINDDVLGYANSELIEEIVNRLFSKNSFQVI